MTYPTFKQCTVKYFSFMRLLFIHKYIPQSTFCFLVIVVAEMNSSFFIRFRNIIQLLKKGLFLGLSPTIMCPCQQSWEVKDRERPLLYEFTTNSTLPLLCWCHQSQLMMLKVSSLSMRGETGRTLIISVQSDSKGRYKVHLCEIPADWEKQQRFHTGGNKTRISGFMCP